MMPLLLAIVPVLLEVAAAALPSAAPDHAADLARGRVVHLEEAERQALQRQPAVLQAHAGTSAAEGRTEQARSGLLPQLTGQAAYQRIHGTANLRGVTTSSTPGSGGTTASGSGTFDYWSFGASATQLIWDFGQTYERMRAAGRSVDASRSNERAVELQVLLNVRRAFFQARAERALIKVAEETVQNQEKHMAQVQGFVATGTRPEIDLAQAKTDLATDRVLLINAQNAYEIAKSILNQAMGAPGDTSYDVADEDPGAIEGEDSSIDLLVSRAVAARPELTSLDGQREAQELTIRSIRGAYGPTLSANAGASATGPSLDALGAGWNVGATLTWPIFQGGLTTGQIHEAEGNLAAVRAQIEAEKLQIRVDVEQAQLTVRAAKASIDAATDALTNARERLRLAEGRYQAGVGSSIELGDAQVAVTNAAAQVVQAQFNLATARAQLRSALGRT